MVKVTFIEFDKTEHTIDAENEMSLMEVAIQNGVPGIDADCGGACACATCHVYIDSNWIDKTGTAEQMEQDMLDFAYSPDENLSRLTCQIEVTDELDGLIVRMPEKQI